MIPENYRLPSQTELDTLLREAQQIRAEALMTILGATGSTLGRGIRAALMWLADMGEGLLNGYRSHQVYQAMSRLSDDRLAAFGLERGDIAAFAAGQFQPRVPKAAEAPTASATVTALKPAAAPIAPPIREAA